MPVTYAQIRAAALKLPGVTEGVAYGTPALYIGRKLVARIRDDNEFVVLRCAPERREELIDKHPDTFLVTDHYLDYPYVLVHLCNAGYEVLEPLVVDAWRMVARKKDLVQFEAGRRPRRLY